MDTVTLTAIDRAMAFAERHGIQSEADWDAQTWFNRWAVYDQFKRELWAERPTDWDGSIQALCDALQV